MTVFGTSPSLLVGRRACRRPIGEVHAARPSLRAVADAASSADEGERLMASAVDWLARSVPAAAVIFSPVDRQLRLFTQGPLIATVDRAAALGALERLPADYLAAMHRVDPYAPSCWSQSTRPVVGIREVGRAERFARSTYGTFLAAYGMASQTSIFLRDRGRIIAAILLLTRQGQSCPTPDELRLLRGTQPLLEQSLILARRLPPAQPDDVLSHSGLTPRECEVARLAVGGATNAEIAVALFLSLATVKTHMSRVLTKTGARSRSELVRLVRDGLAAPVASHASTCPVTPSSTFDAERVPVTGARSA
jgi:DNA-binding CsgD family transcriptional regulator